LAKKLRGDLEIYGVNRIRYHLDNEMIFLWLVAALIVFGMVLAVKIDISILLEKIENNTFSVPHQNG
jgi:hypothetical protein